METHSATLSRPSEWRFEAAGIVRMVKGRKTKPKAQKRKFTNYTKAGTLWVPSKRRDGGRDDDESTRAGIR